METADTNWHVTLNAGNAEVEAVLSQDRVWNCFALADLLPPFREYSQVAIAHRPDTAEYAACLVLQHPALSVVSPFGVPEGVAAILAWLDLPEQALLQTQDAHLPLLRQYYRFQPGERALLRMAVSAKTFQPPTTTSRVRPSLLTSADLIPAQMLYAHFAETHFRADLLEHEVSPLLMPE